MVPTFNDHNQAFVLVLAFPETIVRVSSEWYSPLLPYVGIGRKGYVRAGHAAMVVINKGTGLLEYFDFGRYITPEPYGRVRSANTDSELNFKMVADIQEDRIMNLDEILKVLALSRELTHGEGKLIASVCDVVDYRSIKTYVTTLQNRKFIHYGAFKSQATNCVRFVTEALISSVRDKDVVNKLKQSQWFSPSSVSNVVIANTGQKVYEITGNGEISDFKSSRIKLNASLFFDRLTRVKLNGVSQEKMAKPEREAQWLSGIGSGAWFLLQDIGSRAIYGFKRISDSGRTDVSAKYKISDPTFHIEQSYVFMHDSNCLYFHVKQNDRIYRFDILEKDAS